MKELVKGDVKYLSDRFRAILIRKGDITRKETSYKRDHLWQLQILKKFLWWEWWEDYRYELQYGIGYPSTHLARFNWLHDAMEYVEGDCEDYLLTTNRG